MSDDARTRPNVIFIVIDSPRTDRLEAPTPNLDVWIRDRSSSLTEVA